MSDYPPIGPGATKKRGGLTGCIVAILVVSGLIVALVVSAAIFVGWRLTRDGPPAPPLALRDGTESFYIHARARPDDPGVVALGEKLLATLRESAAAHSGTRSRNPWIDSRQAEGWRGWLPIEIDLARATRDGGTPDAAVVAARFVAMPGTVRAFFRIATFFVPSEADAPLRRTEIDGAPVLLWTPIDGMPGTSFAVTLVGDNLVAARELADLRAAFRPAAEKVEDEPALVAEIVRLADEDGWGYARRREPEPADAIRLAVFSFDIVSDDLVRWRAALRSDRPPADRQVRERALIAELSEVSLPQGLGLSLDSTRRWADDRTLIVEGTVDGIGAAAAAIFKNEPETQPAIPSPKDLDKDPGPRT